MSEEFTNDGLISHGEKLIEAVKNATLTKFFGDRGFSHPEINETELKLILAIVCMAVDGLDKACPTIQGAV